MSTLLPLRRTRVHRQIVRRRRTTRVVAAVAVGTASTFALATEPISAAGDAPNAYVFQGTAIGAIDTATRAPIGGVAVGAAASDIAFSADGTRTFISSSAANLVQIVDTATNAVIETVATGVGPSHLAVSPAGDRIYAMLNDGTLQVIDVASESQVASVAIGAAGDVAVTADGSRAYVAAGALHEIDLATNSLVASFGDQSTTVLLSPDGTRAYVSNGYGVGHVDLTTRTFSVTPPIWNIFSSSIGTIALSPTGDRLFVGAGWTFVDTGYGAGFFPGNTVSVIDTASFSMVGYIALGSSAAGWQGQHLPSGIAVTPDRSAIYVGVPRLSGVVVVNYQTLAIEQTIPMYSPGRIEISPDPDAVVQPYAVDAVDDTAASTTLGGLQAAKNVLSNDRVAGVVANTGNVSLEVLSSSDPAVTLGTDGAITVVAGGAVGTHSLVYRICSLADAAACDQATLTVTIRETYVIDAVADSTTTFSGTMPIANVVANDTLNDAPATFQTVKLTQVSSQHAGIYVVPADGRLYVNVGVPGGSYVLRYRICEIASPVNCDETDVTINVTPNAVNAVDDAGAVTRSGGTAVANVITNDTFNGAAASFTKVGLSTVSSSSPTIALNPITGQVTVSSGAPLGVHTLTYSLCEKAVAANCDTAVVTVTVNPYVIDAVNDYGKGASKYANTVIPNVLVNDRLAGSAVSAGTTGNVKLTRVSLKPANKYIKLNLTTGAVTVTAPTSSGIYTLTYKICEKALLTNCDTATATIELSGGL